MNSTNGETDARNDVTGPVEEDLHLADMTQLGGIELRYIPLELEKLPPQVLQHLQQPAQHRLLLAKSLLPLPPLDMVLVLYALMNDIEDQIAETAEDSFDDLPPNLLRHVAKTRVPWQVLDYIARNFFDENDREHLLELLVVNPYLHVDTLKDILRLCNDGILEMVANNHNRLIKDPEILWAFPENPNINSALMSMALEFAVRMDLVSGEEAETLMAQASGETPVTRSDWKAVRGEEEEALAEDGQAELEASPVEESSEGEPTQEIASETVSENEPAVETTVMDGAATEGGYSDLLFPPFLHEDYEEWAGLEPKEAELGEGPNLRDAIRQMTVPQKIRMASRGNMEARKILIEDRLALVAVAALNSPRITKGEVENAASNKMVQPEILDGIYSDAGHMRNYQIKLALIYNPKTPIGISSKLISFLQEKDMKALAKSKAVPQAVASIARQRIEMAEARRKKRQKENDK